jgi:hypothetical protein
MVPPTCCSYGAGHLLHLGLHLTGHRVLLGLQLLEGKQIQQLLAHLVALLQRLRITTVGIHAALDFLVNAHSHGDTPLGADSGRGAIPKLIEVI